MILRVWDTYLAEHGGSDGDADSPSDGLAVRNLFVGVSCGHHLSISVVHKNLAGPPRVHMCGPIGSLVW